MGVVNGIEKCFLELKGKLSADKKNRPEAPGPLTNQNIRLAACACLRVCDTGFLRDAVSRPFGDV